ncbi:MAG: V-type ATP synthase subunit B [Candidatus Coatesbacteria bacterium]|nr:V-type ATP synthase subunit B [Candidatus Coatesbacteria bacterium]
MSVKEYTGVERINGPLLVVSGTKDIGFGEIVEVLDRNSEKRLGQVLIADMNFVLVQVFEGTKNLDSPATKVRFIGKSVQFAVGKGILGRIFDGLGRLRDNLPPYLAEDFLSVNGLPINPIKRQYPEDFIQTGISSIDGLNTLIRGQKLPIFSGAGLPSHRLAAQIATQSRLLGGEDFVVVFAAMGVKNDLAEFFVEKLSQTSGSSRSVFFLNLANEPAIERIITPRCALTAAEYLAYTLGMHVLVIMIDMTSYCEALRETAIAKEEVPSQKGYPGYLYSDLASLYERTGRIKGRSGSITQIAILTMPNDDISHPVPDLTGYITEGQIVLDRRLYGLGINPPINVLPSLSRLMKDGIGKDKTREDHVNLSSQLYAAYAKVHEIRALAAIIGEEDLSSLDRSYIEFGNRFEKEFIGQGFDVERKLEETLNLGWSILRILPRSELTRVTEEEIERYL